jgi:small conductance mechanosensitive channel
VNVNHSDVDGAGRFHLTNAATNLFMAAQTNAVTNATSDLSHWKDKLIDYSIDHAGALLSAMVVAVVGFVAARWIGKMLDRWLTHKNMEQPMRTLLVRIVRLLITGMALIVALSTAGMNVTALIAGAGVAGVGVGLAMQGVLSNLVAGLTIIFTKPFRVGEYIALLNVQGQVKSVELFSTTLTHPDLSRVVIPNRKIVGEILHNYGHIRQLELSVGVAYGTDLNNALAIARAVLAQNPRVLKDPAPGVGVAMLSDSSINLAIKPWTKVEDYNPATAEINQAIVEAFRASKIEIPFPQREVRMLNG